MSHLTPCIGSTRSVNLTQQQDQSGFSLVEIMVAATISLVLMLGVVQIFVSSKHGYELQDDLSILQENARFASRFLEYSLRMAGNWAGVAEGRFSGGDQVTVTGDCATNWAVKAESLRGYEGAATSPLSLCVTDSNYLANTDLLAVRYLGAESAPVEAGAANEFSSYGANDVMARIALGKIGWFFLGSTVKQDSDYGKNVDSVILQREPAGGARSYCQGYQGICFNYPFKMELYYIRTNNSAGSTNGPLLVRAVLKNGKIETETLVEGVEQLQFAYGVDANNSQSVSQYLPASSVTNWSQVVAVQMSLVVRTRSEDAAFSDTESHPKGYPLAGGYTYKPADADKHYRRYALTKVIQVRNRQRG